jgi:hypothetical protein
VQHSNDKIKSKEKEFRHNQQIGIFFHIFRLSEQIDELKKLPANDNDEDVFILRTERTRVEEDLRTVRIERDTLQQDNHQKENLLSKYEDDMKTQVEVVARLNHQVRYNHKYPIEFILTNILDSSIKKRTR